MKKTLSIALVLVLVVTFASGAFAAEPSSVTAVPLTAHVFVNGIPVAVEAYSVEGIAFFKLRDMAVVLSETEKPFQVIWNDEDKSIEITTGIDYIVRVVTSLAADPAVEPAESVIAALNNSPVYVNGNMMAFTAYTIKNSNYFNLFELGEAIGFAVTYDEVADLYAITTGISG